MDAATRLIWIRVACGILPLILMAIAPQESKAQLGWGDRSFDNSTVSNSDRRWEGSWLAPTGSNRNWQFGVLVDNTETGAVVRQVDPNSSAARSGLVQGDVIVCVAGDQVGRVGNQIYDIEEEVSRHADSSGRVSMLILDRRLGQLKPLEVQLGNTRAGLSGTLTINGGERLPMDAVVTIRLENESRPNYQIRNGESSFRLSNFGVGNIPFELNYDQSYISNIDTYFLRAMVTSGGRTIYQTQRPTYVLTKGNPTNVQLTLVPAIYQPIGGNFIQTGYVPANVYQQQINAAYQRYLNRLPTTMELAAFERMPDIAARVQRLPADLMATEEFFSQMGGSMDSWLRAAFRELVGHAPSSTEIDLWMRRFGELRYSRTELLNQLAMQARG